ncbi:GPI inositol-deacylase [Aeromicrobium wangtongii]|uniref:GPI inositol-deacylase n=1 Tax=Aeromicrobium wangtongii TaxID=2969247 RepID=A0ABY5M6R0_9ACTN|nr:GPI inositol-deacylase [Aeromicrobium wangtongii]MCD9199889.1 GPI inositol-deacylase [Aeromicrobium wangtongii]UUP13507.1 GPI inositol-deacylase [Aeromicrobium wangtongii]
MGDDLQIRGGAGGVTASYEDMLSYASVLDDAGDDLRAKSGDLLKLMVDGDILQAAVLCPGEVAGVEAAIDAVATGPDGALWTSGELEVTARFLRLSVTTMRETDELLAGAQELVWNVSGWTAGLLAPAAAVAGLGVLASNPLLAALLLRNKDALLSDLQTTLYDNPWMLEALTRMAPGMIQGGAFSLASLIPGGPLALMAMTDGNWPSGDYSSAIAGLLALAGKGGLLEDTGDFRVDPVKDSEIDIDIDGDNALRTIFEQQDRIGDTPGQVQVIRVDHGDGDPSWIVQIPGTQVWDPKRGDNPVDLTSNVNMMAMPDQTVIEQQVADAMRAAGIGPGQDVMLTGHSQGGITAASMATDPDLLDEFDIKSVVTGGSPIGRFDIPDDISVLSLEHLQDVVPKLDGTDNPDRPNWTTVTRELSDAEGTAKGQRGPGPAHSLPNYADSGADVDASDDPGIEDWRRDQEQFFNGDASGTRYQISPEKR